MADHANPPIWCVGVGKYKGWRPELIAVGASVRSGLNALCWSKAGFVRRSYLDTRTWKQTPEQVEWAEEEFFGYFGTTRYESGKHFVNRLRKIPAHFLDQLALDPPNPRTGRSATYSREQDESLLLEAFRQGSRLSLDEARALAHDNGRC